MIAHQFLKITFESYYTIEHNYYTSKACLMHYACILHDFFKHDVGELW